MGFIPLDNIIRSAMGSKGYDTLHKYVPYLHWGSKGVEEFQSEGFYTNIRMTSENADENNCIPFPEDMLMWNKIGIVTNGVMSVFVNNDALSLNPKDHNQSVGANNVGLFAYGSGAIDVLYTTNVYVSNEDGVVVVNTAKRASFRTNWEEKKFQISGYVGNNEIYLEYIAKAFSPTDATLVNEVATDYIENFIFYREARFTFGASHRETLAAEREWLNSQDDLAAEMSDLTAAGLLRALSGGTRRSIDQ